MNDHSAPTPPRDPMIPAELNFDMARYYHLFRRRLWLVLTVVGLCLILALAYILRAPKVYASVAILQFEQFEQKVVKMEDVQSENRNAFEYLKTFEDAMTNSSLLYQVVVDAGLDKDPRFAPPLKNGGQYTELQLAERFRSKIKVALKRGTRLMTITVRDKNAAQAKRLADLFIKDYLKQYFSQRLALSQAASEFLQEESVKLKAKLEESEQKLQFYKEQNNAVSLEDSRKVTIERLKEVDSRVTQFKSDRLKLESDLEGLKRLAPEDSEGLLQIGSVAKLEDVITIREQIFKAEADLAAIKKRYLPKHWKYIEASSQVDRLKQSLSETLRNAGDILAKQYAASLETEQKMAASLSEQEKSALALNRIAIPYNVLLREVESDRQMYDTVITRLREMSVTEGIDKSPFRVIQEPMIPGRPIPVHRFLILVGAILVGFLISIAVIAGLDMADSSLQSVGPSEQYLGLACLAAIPELRKSAKDDSVQRPIVMVDDPGSLQAEGFRTLRTSVSLLGSEESRAVFLITSAVPSEGKSFSSVNMATAFALEGHRTLLIDADLRRPTLQSILLTGKEDRVGLSDLLAGNATQGTAIHPTEIPDLHFLPAGRKAPNPAELLSGRQMPALLTELRSSFDRIVLDSAPVNAVSDTLCLVALVQYVCLIVRAGKTPKQAVLRAAHLVKKAGGKMAGFVMNRVIADGSAGYYYYQYGDEYSKDSVYGRSADKK